MSFQIAMFCVASVFCGVLWLTTHRDPLFWAAAVFLVIRAVIIQAFNSGAVFFRHFRLRFRGTLERVQAEVRVV